MNERELWWKILLVGALAGFAILSAFPLEEKLKFGIDLYGGYSLLYEIDDSGLDADQKSDLSERVMRVLQERVDPEGVMNLVWRPVGTNRLEIQMPRPSDEVLKYRAEFDQARDTLKATTIKRSELLVALAQPAGREAALAALVRGVPARSALLKEASALQDTVAKAQAEKDLDKLTEAEEALEQKLDAILATNVDLTRLQTALELGAGTKFRQDELDKLVSSVSPEEAGMVKAVIAAYDKWRLRRGREGVLDDPADLQRLLRGAGVLEFRILAEVDPADPTRFDVYRDNLRKYGPRARPGEETFGWFEIEKPNDFFRVRGGRDLSKEFDRIKLQYSFITERYGEKYYVLSYLTPNKTLTHDAGEADWSLAAAYSTRDEQGRPAIGFRLDERGGARFEPLTRSNKDKQLCIFLDDKAVSSANINSAIRTTGIIQGTFTPKEVQELVKKLNAGSLPRKLKEPPISVRAIGPSLGKANRDAGLTSAKYAAAVVVVFMTVIYLYAGFVAIIAVGMNILMILGLLATIQATLTLPGLAGLVLSLGMAVDANILINERIREELAKGTGLRMAIRLGYDRAFSAIFDSNLTTIITSTVLYVLASEEIKGFGLTLGAGALINLFTAVFMTRVYFEFMTTPRVPGLTLKYVLPVGLGAAVLGGGAWALGASMAAPGEAATSRLVGLGQMLSAVAAGVLGGLLLMVICRGIHQAVSAGRERLPMLRVIGQTNVDWYGLRRGFYAFSLVLSLGGLALFLTRDENRLYDIEFLGGTAAQVDLRTPGSIDAAGIEERLRQSSAEIKRYADAIDAQASVSARGGEFDVTTPGVPAARAVDFLQGVLSDVLAPNGVRENGAERVTVVLKPDLGVEVEGKAAATEPAARSGLKGLLKTVTAQMRLDADSLADAQVQEVQSLEPGALQGASYEIVSRVTSKEVVVAAILSSMRELVDIAPALSFQFVKNPRMGDVDFFPVTDKNLSAVTGDSSMVADLAQWMGGAVLVLDQVSPPQSPAALERRLKAMRLQPGFEQYGWRDSAVLGLMPSAESPELHTRVAIVAADENFAYNEAADSSEGWRGNLAEPEAKLAREALERQTSLSKITQFAPQVAQEAKTKAIIALVVSWLAIILYVWFRFGNVVWGTAAVIALVHDVLVVLGLLAASHFIAQSAIGKALMIDAFRIDLSIVAALLTVIGYAVNDSIVVFDRIRENRGKLTEVKPQIVTTSINQTLSRTMLTGFTTILTIIIMYAFGGRGIHGFMFSMLIGIVIGTYGSIFVASPLLIAMQRRAVSAAR